MSPQLRDRLYETYDFQKFWSHFAREWHDRAPDREERLAIFERALKEIGGEVVAYAEGGSGKLNDAIREQAVWWYQMRYREVECLELADA